MLYVVAGGVATEELSGELLLCDATGTSVHRISGEARHYFEQLGDGPVELPDDEVTAALLASGVIVPFAAGVSRRRAIAMGAAAAAAVGVVTVGLPSAAMAASENNPADYPEAPTGGTVPAGPDQQLGARQSSAGVTNRRTGYSWFNDEDQTQPVTFSYALYVPASAADPVLEGTAIGNTSPNLFGNLIQSPPAGVGVTYLWLVRASGGKRASASGSWN